MKTKEHEPSNTDNSRWVDVNPTLPKVYSGWETISQTLRLLISSNQGWISRCHLYNGREIEPHFQDEVLWLEKIQDDLHKLLTEVTSKG